MTAVPMSTALGVDGIGRTHWTVRVNSSTPTAIPQQHADEEDGHHLLIHSHTVHDHTPTNDHDQR